MQREKSKSQETFDFTFTCEIFKGSFKRKKRKDERSSFRRIIINKYKHLSFFMRNLMLHLSIIKLLSTMLKIAIILIFLISSLQLDTSVIFQSTNQLL